MGGVGVAGVSGWPIPLVSGWETCGRRGERQPDVAMRFAVAGLVLSGATNAVVGVLNAMGWAWWVAGACLLAIGVWSGLDGERAARRRSGQGGQVRFGVGAVEPAALVCGHR